MRNLPVSIFQLAILLLALLPMIYGCATFTGLSIGDSYDEEKEYLKLVKDFAELKPYEHVFIVTVSDKQYRGWITEISQDSTLTIEQAYTSRREDLGPSKTSVAIAWDDMDQLFFVKQRVRGKVIGGTAGFLIDMSFALLILAVILLPSVGMPV